MKKIIYSLILLFLIQNGVNAQKIYTIGTTANNKDVMKLSYTMRLYEDGKVKRQIENASPQCMALYLKNDQGNLYTFKQATINRKYIQMDVLKNDQKLYTLALTDGQIYIKDVCIDHSDIYLVGEAVTIENGKRTYNIWKNGELLSTLSTNRPDLDVSGISAICVNQGNIYMAGTVVWKDKSQGRRDQVAVWKNGELTHVFSEGASNLTEAVSIVVHNDDVYVAGRGAISGYNANVLVWKNGTLVYTSPERGSAVKMIEDGGSIYLLGSYPRKPTQLFVLKDFKPLFEIAEKESCEAYSMAIHSGDVYVVGGLVKAGETPKLGKVWKNGKTLYDFKGIGNEKSIWVKDIVVL